MAEEASQPTDQRNMNPYIKRWGLYILKAAVSLGLIYLAVHVIPTLPPIAIGICWAVMSSIVAIGIAYPYIIRKLLNRQEFVPEGHWYKLFDGRIIRLLISFIIAMLLVAGLILETSKWSGPEWIAAIAAAPVFLVFYAIAQRIAKNEIREQFKVARIIRASRIATAILLCLVYLAILSLSQAETYSNAAEAFLASTNPFDTSASALLCEAGKCAELIDGLYAYMLSTAAQVSPFAYTAAKTILEFSVFYSISSIMGLCSLPLPEIRRVFASLDQPEANSASPKPVKRSVAVIVILPILLTITFVSVDSKVCEIKSTQEYTAVDQFIRNQAGLVVCMIDGKYYDYESVQSYLQQLADDSNSLGEAAKKELTPLINEAFDKRIENVDNYLDWYYGLSADYESLGSLVNSTVEDFMCEKLKSHINEGVDDSLLNERIEYYARKAEALESAAKEELAAYEVDVPEWLIKTEESIDLNAFNVSLDTTKKLKEAGMRLAAGGVSAFAINHLIGKKIIKKMITKLATKLGISAGEKVATIAFVAAGPPGVVLKTGADVVTTIALDVLFLKADEMMNRENYKKEIIDGINEERNEMLAMIG